jgi:hypothetical protein
MRPFAHTRAIRRRRHCVLGAPIAAASVLALAACGASGQAPSAPSGHAPSTPSGHAAGVSSRSAPLLAYARCMRSHGVSRFPDPGPSGFDLNGSAINPFSPAFRTAQDTCNKLLPGGGPPLQASRQQKRRLDAISQCMRTHGVPDFPDPTTTAPTSLASIQRDYSLAERIAGNLFLLIPNTINPNAPAFKRAAGTCGFR